MKKISLLFLFVIAAWGILPMFAQTDRLPDIRLPFPPDGTQLEVRTTNLPDIKKLHYQTIDGAPVLKQPVRIDGSRREIRTEEHGLAYPTLFGTATASPISWWVSSLRASRASKYT